MRHEAFLDPTRSPGGENLSELQALLAHWADTSRRDLLLTAELLELPTTDLYPRWNDAAQRNAETAVVEDFVLGLLGRMLPVLLPLGRPPSRSHDPSPGGTAVGAH
jgi:hypothetical protein